jgi:hypothetical protein
MDLGAASLVSRLGNGKHIDPASILSREVEPDRWRKRMRQLMFLSLLFLGGCYKYVPLEAPLGEVERGTSLRTYFAAEQSVDLYDLTAHNITAMDVEFVRQEDSEFLFSAFYLESSARDAGYLGNGWTVRVPVESVSRVEVKKFDILRTLGLGALAVAGSILGWELIGGSLGDGDDPGDTEGEIF